MSEKIENHDDWFDNFGDAPDSSDGNAPSPQSDDNDWGISDSSSADSTTDDFVIASSSDSDADQLEKDGWICGKNICQPLVEGDTVRFNETSFDRNDHWHKKSNGCRLNVAKIVRINYDKKGEATVHFEIIESTGDAPLSAGKKYYRYFRNIVRRKCYRKCWNDESLRQELVEISKINLENIQREIWQNEKEAEDEMVAGIKRCVGKKTVLSDAESNRTLEEVKPPILPLSAAQQKWVDDGWLKDIDKQRLNSHKLEKGWKEMSDTNDRVVEGDIIRFMYTIFSGRFPHGKKGGRNIIIAKVVKVAREYYHLQFIASTGSVPYIDKRKQTFRKKFSTVEYWSFHRLWWNCEPLRKDKLGKRLKIKFSQSEYEEYIGQSQVESPAENNKKEPSNNQEINNLLKEQNIMQNRFDVEQWLKEQNGTGIFLFISEGYYYKLSRGKNPSPIQVSNFILKAEAQIMQDNKWWFECTAINDEGIIQEGLMFSQNDFQSSSAFKRVVTCNSRLEFYGDNKDVTRIRSSLTKQNPPSKTGTGRPGIHKINGRWMYAEGNNIIDSNGYIDDVVFTGATLNQNEIPTLLQQPDLTVNERKAIAENFNRFNEPSIVYPLLGWIGFCFVKERLGQKVNKRNPILLCQGEPGVGKTETFSRIVQPIFCSQRPISNVADMTKFTLAVNGSRSNFDPCCYDEWKPWVMAKQRIKDLDSVMLATFNQTNLPRGTADQTVNQYRFTSPTAVLGEMTFDSASLKHRVIELFFNYKGRNGREQCFNTLCNLPLGSLGKGLMLHMLSTSDEQLDKIFDEQRASVDPFINDRFADNAALARVGLWLIIDYFKVNGIATDDYAEGYGYIDSAIKESLLAARITNVDKIISDMSVMTHTKNCSGNWLHNGEHYEIRDGKLLYLKISEAYEAYRRYAKTNVVSAEMVNKSSFLQQLATRPYFEGKKTVRIGGEPCNGICINLSAIPDYIEVNFAA